MSLKFENSVSREDSNMCDVVDDDYGLFCEAQLVLRILRVVPFHLFGGAVNNLEYSSLHTQRVGLQSLELMALRDGLAWVKFSVFSPTRWSLHISLRSTSSLVFICLTLSFCCCCCWRGVENLVS